MSRPSATMDGGGSVSSRTVPTRLLASAHSCARCAQLSLESLGCASNLFLFTGVGAGLAASFLSGLMIDRGLSLASSERLRQATSGFAGSIPLAVELP